MAIPADLGLAVDGMVALVFVSAAGGKMRNWATFQGVVANYRLLPEFSIRPAAWLLPPVELLIGVGLLTPWVRAAEFCAAGMLLVFAAAMAVNLRRGRAHIDCGCFQSTLKQTLRWRLVARNAVVTALLLTLALAADGSVSLDSWSTTNGLLGAVALFIVWQGLNTLWSIVPAFGRSRAPAHAHSEEST